MRIVLFYGADGKPVAVNLAVKPAGALLALLVVGISVYVAVHRSNQEHDATLAAPPSASPTPPPANAPLITTAPDFMGGTFATVKTSSAPDSPPGVTAVNHIVITKKPVNIWDIGFSGNTTTALKKGQKLVYSVWARSDKVVHADVKFEKRDSPYTSSFIKTIDLTPKWKQYTFPFSSAEDYAPALAAARFHVGYGIGSVDMANMQVTVAP